MRRQWPIRRTEVALNLTFLVASTNVFMSDDAPSVYLTKLIQRRMADHKIPQHEATEQVRAVLRTHLIDGAGFDAAMADDYDAFLEARATTVRAVLATAYGVPIVEATNLDEEEIEEPAVEDESTLE